MSEVPAGGCGPRALVVDDEEVIRELLTNLLEDQHYEVTAVDCGRGALDELRIRPFDVVVMDVMMPGEMSGLATLREIRRIRPESRVVMMTGRVCDHELEEQLRPADALILKPFHCHQLIDCIRKLAG